MSGYGCEYHESRTTLEVAQDAGKEARTNALNIAKGSTLMIWRDDAVIAQVRGDGEGSYVMASSINSEHRLAIKVTDPARLAAHFEGYVEIALAKIGHPTQRRHLSMIY